MRYFIKCSECGKFCQPYDQGTYYGGVLDSEPPEDPDFFCKKCVVKKLKTPERIIVGCWLYKPTYVRMAKSIIRHRKKILC